MFKEKATDKLIEYIQSLPLSEQKIIAEKITKKNVLLKNASAKNIQGFIAYTKKFRGRLPKNYKFDREEANER
jgi:hypothetical protein